MKTAVLLVVALAFAQESSGTPFGLLKDITGLIGGTLAGVGKVVESLETVATNLVKGVLEAVNNILEDIFQKLENHLLTLEQAKSQLVQKLVTYLKTIEGITQPIIDAIIKEVYELLALVKEIPDLREVVPKIKAVIEKHLSELTAATAPEAPTDAAVSR